MQDERVTSFIDDPLFYTFQLSYNETEYILFALSGDRTIQILKWTIETTKQEYKYQI